MKHSMSMTGRHHACSEGHRADGNNRIFSRLRYSFIRITCGICLISMTFAVCQCRDASGSISPEELMTMLSTTGGHMTLEVRYLGMT